MKEKQFAEIAKTKSENLFPAFALLKIKSNLENSGIFS